MDNTSNCENMVMVTIYDTPKPMALHEILKKVNEKFNKNWKPQTVSTFLTRLVKKDYLRVERQGRYTLYRPTYTVKQYRERICMEICKTFFHGNMKELKEFVNELEEEHDR